MENTIEKENSLDTEITSDTTEKSNDDMLLYVLADKENSLMLKYIRDKGLNVTDVFRSPSEVNRLLLLDSPCRLIIMDMGTGRFTGYVSRKDLIDIIGICDEDIKISIFYTDNSLKSEWQKTISNNSANMIWSKYRSIVDTVASILKYNESYKFGEDFKEVSEVEADELLSHRGYDASIHSSDRINTPDILFGLYDVMQSQDSLKDFDFKL